MRTTVGIPGFVDLQVNGYKGMDFSHPELTKADMRRACRRLLQSGTAAFLPTVITSLPELYERNLPLIAEVIKEQEFEGRLLGIHLEGPFISAESGAIGAHNPEWVLPPDIELFDRLCELAAGTVRILTIAAEAPGAEELARHAVERGVVVSLGHQLPTVTDMERLRDAGATSLTHLGNGLPNMLPRLENPIFAGLATDGLAVGLIADGHHLPPSFLKTAIRAKGVQNTIIVSDAAPLAGMPPGHYKTLGNDVVLEPNGLLHNPTKGHKVGSSATLLQCMNHLASLGFLTFDELLQVGFYNPLRLIGMEPKALRAGHTLLYDPEQQTFAVDDSK